MRHNDHRCPKCKGWLNESHGCDACDSQGSPPVAGSAHIVQPKEFALELPAQIKRPCDYGLELAVTHLETELGTIEAYNRVVRAAEALRTTIDADQSKAPNPCYANSVRGGAPNT